jgi:predicted nucleotidyltransferase
MEPDLLQPLVDHLVAALPRLQAVYLFGSRSQGTNHLGSDVDLAVLQPVRQPDRTALGLYHLRGELEELAGRRVDLVDLRQASTVLQIQVLGGRLLVVRDPAAVDEFEMMALSYYQALNHRRREVLDEVRRTGRVCAC